ncbi:MAG: hypothetical protein FGF53_01410, partial [Candidatus Brockarchaeota archaeon]|nr:hypothetical protein [Candidatus Brockarchaeota archaeon]
SFLSFDSQILLSIIMPDRLLTEETFNFPGLRGEGRARRDACLRYDVGRRRHVGGCGGFAHRCSPIPLAAVFEEAYENQPYSLGPLGRRI